MSLCQTENDFINEITSERQGEIDAQTGECSGRFVLKRKAELQIRKSQGLRVKRMCAPAAFRRAVFDITLGPVHQHRSDQMALQLDQWFAQEPK